jgi:hypothetical protein
VSGLAKMVSRETSAMFHAGRESASGKRDSAKQPHALKNIPCFSKI